MKYLIGFVFGVLFMVILLIINAEYRWKNFYVFHHHIGYTVIDHDSVRYNDGCRAKYNWHQHPKPVFHGIH